MKKHTIRVEVRRQIYRNDSGWSIYGVVPLEDVDQFKLNRFGNITIKGETRPLHAGEEYNVTIFGPVKDPKYGDGYDLQWTEPERLETIEQQDAYLQTLLTEKQFDTIKGAYPNEMLLDLINEDKIDVSQLNGIKQKTLDKIKKKISENSHISVLVACLADLELSIKKIEKIMTHFESPDDAVEAIRRNIYVLCEIKTFGFKTIDQIAMNRGDNPTNHNRIKACLGFLLEQDMSQGHTWSHRHEIIQQAEELLQINPQLIEKALEQFNESRTVLLEGSRIMLPKPVSEEAQVAHHLKRIYQSYVTVSNLAEIVDYRIQQVEEAQGFTFTEEQRSAIEDGMNHGVMVVNGSAGAGKTATVKGLIDVLGTSNYMTCGLSGKSAQVLSQRGIESSTIHRMLGFKDGKFLYNEEDPLPYDAVVVDEISMVNVGLLLCVLRAVPEGCKLILVGDSGQLPAIGYGDVLRDLIDTKTYPVYRLSKVHRQASKSGILSLANTVREGNQIVQYNGSGKEIHGELQDQIVVSVPSEQKNLIPESVLGIASEYKSKIKTLEDLFEFQVLVANKERGELSVRKLNQQMQQIFNDMKKPFLLRNGYGFREGDKVISQGNSYSKRHYSDVNDYKEWYKKDRKVDQSNKEKVDVEEEDMYENTNRDNVSNVFNGTMGYVHTIDLLNKVALVKFENSPHLYPYTQDEMEKLDMAYAITVHKSQGSGFKDLVFAIDFGAFTLLNRQLIYTAITRASRKGVLICENNALFQAIKTDASGIRRTTLGEVLLEQMQESLGGAEGD